MGRREFRSLLEQGDEQEIAARAVRIESRTNLLYSFEKMALRDAVKSRGAREHLPRVSSSFCTALALTRKNSRNGVRQLAHYHGGKHGVLTWPLVTVFGFIAQPDRHIFLKPNVTRVAAREYEFDFIYQSKPTWEIYASLLEFADVVR